MASQNAWVNNYCGTITINAANTQNINSSSYAVANLATGLTIQSGATGTISNLYGWHCTGFTNNASGIAINQVSLISFDAFGNSGIITNMHGIVIPAFTGGTITNQVSLLLGTTTSPAGNYGIYSATPYNNQLGSGNTQAGSFSTTGSGGLTLAVSSVPSTPTGAVTLFAPANNELSILDASGKVATLNTGSMTANHVFSYPDIDGTFFMKPTGSATTQYIAGDGSIQNNSSLNTTFLTYTGATHYLDMGNYPIYSDTIEITNSPSSGQAPGAVVFIASNNDPVNGAVAVFQGGVGRTHFNTQWVSTDDTTVLATMWGNGDLDLLGDLTTAKVKIATGTNSSIGTATLAAGTVTVNTTAVTASSKIFVSVRTPGGTQGFLSTPSSGVTAGTSFVINSTSSSETSTVDWWIIN